MPKVKMCRTPGCGLLADESGYCAKHQRFRVADAPKPRTPWDGANRPNRELYNTQRWKVLRDKVRKERGECVVCGSGIHTINRWKGVMNLEKRRAIFGRLQQANPNPTTELEYTTPFELLAAVLLSAQATDVSVNAATRKLFPVANTPQAILKLGNAKLESFIKTIGLYKTKAKHLLQTCELELQDFFEHTSTLST